MNPLINDVDDKHKERGRNEPECIFHVLVITLMLLSGIHGPVQITAIILEIQFFNRIIFHVPEIILTKSDSNEVSLFSCAKYYSASKRFKR